MADPVTIPSPAAQDQSAVASAQQLQPPPLPTAGTQQNDPGGSSFEPQQDVATQFNKQMLEPYLQQYVSSFRTTEGRAQAQSQADQLRIHMLQKQQGDMASIAGHQAITDTESNLNSLATLSREDPTSTDLALQMFGSHLDNVVKNAPNMTAEQAAAIHQEFQTKGQQTIAMAHYYGTATRTPLVALDELHSGKYAAFLPEGAAQAIESHANAVLRAQAADQKTQQAQAAIAGKAQASAAAKSIFTHAIQPDGTLNFAPNASQQIQQLGGFQYSSLEELKALQGAMEASTRAKIEGTYIQSDPHTFSSMIGRAGIPDGQPGAITDTELYTARAHSLLNDKDTSIIAKARADAASNPQAGVARTQITSLLTNLKPTLTKSDPLGKLVDYAGDQKYDQLLHDVWMEYDAGLAAGKSPNEVRDALGDPNNPHSIYHQATTLALTQQQTQDYLNRLGSKGPAQVPALNNPDLQFYRNGGWSGNKPSAGTPGGIAQDEATRKMINGFAAARPAPVAAPPKAAAKAAPVNPLVKMPLPGKL